VVSRNRIKRLPAKTTVPTTLSRVCGDSPCSGWFPKGDVASAQSRKHRKIKNINLVIFGQLNRVNKVAPVSGVLKIFEAPETSHCILGELR